MSRFILREQPVAAVQLQHAVTIWDGEYDILFEGRAGDWLVEFADREQAVLSDTLFKLLCEPASEAAYEAVKPPLSVVPFKFEVGAISLVPRAYTAPQPVERSYTMSGGYNVEVVTSLGDITFGIEDATPPTREDFNPDFINPDACLPGCDPGDCTCQTDAKRRAANVGVPEDHPSVRRAIQRSQDICCEGRRKDADDVEDAPRS